MEKIIVVGAGISGLSAAQLLQERGNEVLVLEAKSELGGLISCDVVDGVLFHRVGGHVFNAKNKVVFDWFWKFFDRETEFLKAKRVAKIWFQGQFIGYPIENYLYMLDKSIVSDVVKDVLQAQKKGYVDPFSYPNFEAFLKGNFGETLYNLYFKPYNHKIWKTDLSKVALEWLEGKLPMPNYADMLISNIVREEDDTMVHSTFFYPRAGGSQFIADRLAQGLNVTTNHAVTSIELKHEKPIVDGIIADKLVYTGDVRQLKTIIRTDNREIQDLLHKASLFASNGTSNLLCETDDMPYSWLYIPESQFSAHRIIYTGNFSDSNNRAGGRRTCTVEFSGKVAHDEMLRQLTFLPGNMKMLDMNYEPNSYVIQDSDTRSVVAALKNVLKPYGVFLSGRFAEWEYHNMDKAIEASMNTISQF